MAKLPTKWKADRPGLPRLQLTSQLSISRQTLKAFLAIQTACASQQLPPSPKPMSRQIPGTRPPPHLLRKAVPTHLPKTFPHIQGRKSILADRNPSLAVSRTTFFKHRTGSLRIKCLGDSFSSTDQAQDLHQARHSLGDYPSPWTVCDG